MKARDLEDLKVLKKYHEKSKHKDGIRQLEMIIPREEGLIMNHKKIARLKSKYKLITKIRPKISIDTLLKKSMSMRVVQIYLRGTLKTLKLIKSIQQI